MVFLETDQSKGKLFWALCTTINDDDDDDDNNNNNNIIIIIIIRYKTLFIDLKK